MKPNCALKPTGNTTIDRTLQRLVDAFETELPDRIRGYYLEGSYADQTALTTSDVDLIILFRGAFLDEAEREKAGQIVAYYTAESGIELDVGFLEDRQIANGAPPALKLGSTVLYGEPVPDDLPLVPIADWGRERMHIAYWLMTKVFNRPDVVIYPRGYPQPDADFYGYTERTVRSPDGHDVPSTRDLIRVMGWTATALIAHLKHTIVARKKECHVLYQKHINDEWGPLLASIYKKCREEWQYRIPEEQEEREQLRSICQRALAFENHFLKVYKQFLLSELGDAAMPAKRHALWVLAKIPYMDQEIIAAVRDLLNSKDEDLIQRAADALQALDRTRQETT